MKTCNSCKKEMHATREYWHKSGGNKDGWHRTCKKCRATQGTQFSPSDRFLSRIADKNRPTVPE